MDFLAGWRKQWDDLLLSCLLSCLLCVLKKELYGQVGEKYIIPPIIHFPSTLHSLSFSHLPFCCLFDVLLPAASLWLLLLYTCYWEIWSIHASKRH